MGLESLGMNVGTLGGPRLEDLVSECPALEGSDLEGLVWTGFTGLGFARLGFGRVGF